MRWARAIGGIVPPLKVKRGGGDGRGTVQPKVCWPAGVAATCTPAGSESVNRGRPVRAEAVGS